MRTSSHLLDTALARWQSEHFAPVVLSSGEATEVCRHCGGDLDAHDVRGSSLPCPSRSTGESTRRSPS
jgi:hypothetical protein